MANASDFLIGANDEHGLNPPTLGKRSPILPYINRSFYENEFNREAKSYFIEACLRTGFRIYDVKPEITDISISTRIVRIRRQNLTLLVTFAYNASGSGLTFNSGEGFEIFYSTRNPDPTRSRQLSEYIYNRIVQNTDRKGRGVNTLNVSVLSSVNCPSTLIEAGFMTNFYEAKLMLDPDYALAIGESACQGVCDFLGVVYILAIIWQITALCVLEVKEIKSCFCNTCSIVTGTISSQTEILVAKHLVRLRIFKKITI